MSNFNIMGSYSGIDMSVIDQMIEAEKAKGVKFTNQKKKIERQQGAWKDVGSRLDSLSKKINVLNDRSTFESRKVKSTAGDRSSVSVTAGNSAPTGNYQISVEKLATSVRKVGGKIDFSKGDSSKAPIDRALGLTESFKFSNHENKEFTIEVGAEDSLRSITQNINAQTKESGIEASIVDNRLVLTDAKMGDREITIESNATANGLGFADDSVTTVKGQGAIFTIDGIRIERDTNQISDAIEGVTFNLISEGASEVISITNDTEKGVTAMKEFIEQYNSVMSFLQTQMDVGSPGESNNTAGALVGEGSIMRLQSALRTTLMKNINGTTLGDFGVEIDRYGVATLDEAKLNEVLQEDPTSLSRFFYQPTLDSSATEGIEGNEGKTKKTLGMAEEFKELINSYTTGSKAIIKTKQESFDRMIKDINQQIETFNERIDKKRDRYIKQFSALDTAMMHAESQLDYLYSQIGLGQK